MKRKPGRTDAQIYDSLDSPTYRAPNPLARVQALAATSSGRSEDERDVSFGGNLSVDARDAVAATGTASQLNEHDLEADDIARSDLAPEAKAIEAGEEWDAALSSPRGQYSNGSHLRQCLSHKNSGHDWVGGKVSRKERFTNGHGFDSYRTLFRLQLDDAIYQKERRSVRNDCLDLVDR